MHVDEVSKAKTTGHKRLAEAAKLAEEAQWKVNHAQEEQDKQLKAAELAVKSARQRMDHTAAALKDKATLKETLALESVEMQKELEQIMVKQTPQLFAVVGLNSLRLKKELPRSHSLYEQY